MLFIKLFIKFVIKLFSLFFLVWSFHFIFSHDDCKCIIGICKEYKCTAVTIAYMNPNINVFRTLLHSTLMSNTGWKN